MSGARIRDSITRRPLLTAAVFLVLVLGAVFLGRMMAYPVVRNTITMDGYFEDWENVLSDPDNVLFDSVEDADPDITQNPDRDYIRFAYTSDSTYLYFYYRRTAAANRAVEDLVYIDRNYDGYFDKNDYVLDFTFASGNVNNANVGGFFNPYPSANSTNTFTGDGVTVTTPEGAAGAHKIISSEVAALAAGMSGAGGPIGTSRELEQEMRITWSALGLAPGTPINIQPAIGVGFSNISQVTDNFGPVDTGFTELSLVPNRDGATAPGTSITYTHTLVQTANVTDTVDFSAISVNGWPAVVKNAQGSVITSMTLRGNETTTVVVEVAVSGTVIAGTVDKTNLDVTSRRDSLVTVRVTDSTYVGALVVYPDRSGTIATGTAIFYPHKISNETSTPLTVDLSAVSWSAWGVSIYDYTGLTTTSTVVVPAGSEVDVFLRVSAPTSSTLGAQDASELRAVARENPVYADFARDVTTIYRALDIRPDQQKQTTPGSVVTYEHTITNSSGSTQTIDLAYVSSRGWTVRLYESTGTTLTSSYTLASNQSITVLARVTVPPHPTATAGTSDTTTITATFQGSSPVVKDIAVDRTDVVTLATYEDPGFRLPQTVYRLGDTIYAQAGGLTIGDARLRWYDPNPSSTLQRDSGSIVVVASKAEDRYISDEADRIGTWTVALMNATGSSEITRTSFTITYDAEITDLRASDAQTASDTVYVDSTLKNSNNATITASYVDYTVWYDVNGDAEFNAGDQWIDTSGLPRSYLSTGTMLSHKSTTITVGPQGTYSEPGAGWTLSNKDFVNWGMYNVSATWYTSGGIFIDRENTTFFSPGSTPEVILTKSLASGQDPVVQVGQAVSYAIRVQNTGDTTLTTVPLRDGFSPALLQYVSAIPPPTSVASGSLLWADVADPGNLNPGQVTTVTVSFVATGVPVGGVASNSVTATRAVDVSGVFANTSTSLADVRITRPALSVTKTASGTATPRIGDLVTYSVNVFNSGDTTVVAGTLLDDWDDARFDFESSLPATVPVGGSASYAFAGLAPGSSYQVTVTLRAKATGSAANTATANGIDFYGDTAGPSSSTATVTVTNPNVAVTKTLLD